MNYLSNVWVLGVLCTLSLHGAQQLQLPKIKKSQKRQKLKMRDGNGRPEYLVKEENKIYWLDKDTIDQLEKFNKFKKDFKEALSLGLSYNDYLLLREKGLLYKQQKHLKKM